MIFTDPYKTKLKLEMFLMYGWSDVQFIDASNVVGERIIH